MSGRQRICAANVLRITTVCSEYMQASWELIQADLPTKCGIWEEGILTQSTL